MASVTLELQGQAIELGVATVFWGGVLADALSDDDAQPLGVAAAGKSNAPARADHVHAMPDAEDVGAIPAASVGEPGGVAPLDDTGKVPAGNLPKAVQSDWNATSAPAQILNQPPISIDPTQSKFNPPAVASANASQAIGWGAEANASNATAVGTQAAATGTLAIALGGSATAGLESIAVGGAATASASIAVAIGCAAIANFVGSAAIGAYASTRAGYQMMLMAGGSTVTTGGLFQLSAYTAASLNAMSAPTAPVGCVALATDALDVGEAAGAGTGCMALKKSTGWVRLADNTPLAT